MRVLQKEVREMKGVLVERQSDLGRNQDELAGMQITEKQLKNARAVARTVKVAKSCGLGEARPLGSISQSVLVSSPSTMVKLGLLVVRLTPNSQSLLAYSSLMLVKLGLLEPR